LRPHGCNPQVNADDVLPFLAAQPEACNLQVNANHCLQSPPSELNFKTSPVFRHGEFQNHGVAVPSVARHWNFSLMEVMP